jgi:hypothetical protein
MRSPVLEQIEGMLRLLSREEQIWLIERLAHDLRESEAKSCIPEQGTLKSQLAAMAADPEVQAELRKIEYEFSVTESDGLEPG